MQVIADSSAGGRLGAALGTGLQQIAQHKLEHLQKQHDTQFAKAQYAKGLAPLFGEGVANLLANVDTETQKTLLQNPEFLMQLGQRMAQEQQQGQGNQQVMQPQEQQSGIGALQGQGRNLNAADFLSNQNVNPLLRQALSGAEIPREALMGMLQQGQAGQQPQVGMAQQPQSVSGQLQPQPNQLGQAIPQQDEEKARLIKEALTPPKQRLEREKLDLERNKLTSREDLAAWKNTLPYREKILGIEEASREALKSIKEAQELEKGGQFPSQQFASFLKGAEWEDVPGFLSGEAEAYNKILANFQRGAKDVYGGRITNFEMEQFLKTIPTLQHTPEGRARIWSMMKSYYRGGKEMAKIERQIIKENGGKPPQDLHEQVNERFRPISKEISKKFKRELEAAEKLSSSYASRLGSVASYGLGKVVGAIPGLLKAGAKGAAGAAGGAAAGSLVPGGTIPGAILGGLYGLGR